jgi:tryptophan-rich sensory protein
MKNLSKFLICVIGCEAVGLLGVPASLKSIPAWYVYLNKPFFAPPNWIFGPVWTVLYFLIGLSVFLIWKKGTQKHKHKEAIQFFLAQLFLNAIWSPIFFGLRSPMLGFINIVAMWVCILFTLLRFKPISKAAFFLMLPYFFWVSFASLLNLAILVLN